MLDVTVDLQIPLPGAGLGDHAADGAGGNGGIVLAPGAGGICHNIVSKPREAHCVNRGAYHVIRGNLQLQRHTLVSGAAQPQNGHIPAGIGAYQKGFFIIARVVVDTDLRPAA